MLAPQALNDLIRDLSAAVRAMGLHSGDFGKPELVEEPTREAERLFQGYAKAKPRKEDAYAAARSFLRGQELDSWQRDIVAAAVADPVQEQNGAVVLGSKRFPVLLAGYEDAIRRGELWRLTWHGLLYSYFHFDPSTTKDAGAREGWNSLQSFLANTWPLIDRQAGHTLVPDWVSVLRNETEILSSKPADRYAQAYLHGDTAATDQLAADLGIPTSSWFWHSLVLSAVTRATAGSDSEFRLLIPRLLRLIQSKPGFRDDALEAILNRYHACKGAPPDEQLRDYVCQPSVWRNPKLKSAGLATAWNRVADPVWQMVLNWVNERNLKDFFDILAARNKADEGRLAFWSRYLKQITWTRLVFGADTMALRSTNSDIRDLISREEGAYAQLTGKREVDAFMMQIGSYLIIEFSKKPNACYVYKADELPFEPYAKHYHGGTEDLGAGFQQKCAARIVHRDRWEARAAQELRDLGIRPDHPTSRSPVSRGTESGSFASGHSASTSSRHSNTAQRGPDLQTLSTLISRFHTATIDDKRNNSNGGRLWVNDPLQRTLLATELKAMGFRWADSKQAWYFPEY
jgi:hypothetical protein